MTSFAKAGFDVASYLAARPTYPPRVFDIITAYHGKTGRWDRLLDVGCGPGFAALALASKFRHTTGIDPSQGMIDRALQPGDPTTSRIEYKVGTVEELDKCGFGEGEAGVDLVVAGQAAHWFDYPKAWRQLTNSVRPGGTVAFIGYAEMTFPHHPKLNSLIAHYARSPNALGPYWQPGRRIVEALLDPVPFPTTPRPPSGDLLGSLPPLLPDGGHPLSPEIQEPALDMPSGLTLDRDSWDPATAVRLKEDSKGGPWLMRKTFTRPLLDEYLRSWSALHDYQEAHPEDAAKGREGDIAGRLLAAVWRGRESESGQRSEEKPGEIEVGWPLVLMMIKKKPAV